MGDTTSFSASKPVLAITGYLIIQSAAIGFWGGDLHRTVSGIESHVEHIDRYGTEGMQRVEAMQESEARRVLALEADRSALGTQYREIDHRLNMIEAKMDQVLAAAVPNKGK